MDFDHSSGLLLVTVEGEEGIVLYDSSTLKRLEVIRTGASHSDVAVNPSTHIAVALDRHGNNIFIVDIKKKSLIKTIPSREELGQAAIDPYVNIAVISHKGGILLLKLENPVPEIGHIVPSDAGVGESGFVLTIEGLKFVRDSQAQFNKMDVQTHFLGNSLLRADIFAGHLSSAGDVPVTVTNPAPGGGISNALPFRIYNPAPAIESVTPETVAAGSTFNIRVRGKNFFNGSTININGEDIKTRFISSILLEAVVTPLHIKKGGRYPVIVMNPASHGGIKSNVLYLNAVEETAALLHKEAQETDKEKSKAKGEGSLKGRILNTYLEPLEGVSVKIKNQKTTTDAGGYFLLEKIPGGKTLLLVDGATEKKQKGKYPTIPLTVNIQENKMNDMPFKIYLHRQKDKDFKNINPNEDTTLKDPDVPGFEMRILKESKLSVGTTSRISRSLSGQCRQTGFP